MTESMSGAANENLMAAMEPNHSMLFYTITITVPLIIISAWLLVSNRSGTPLVVLSILGAITGFVGLGRLLYEMTLEIAGFPNMKLPIWSVIYLIIYLISAFAFLYFMLHNLSPGRYLTGFDLKSEKMAFLDALYLSMGYYIGMSPDGSFGLNSILPRMLTVVEGVIAMFINVVIIAKFVNTF